MVKIEGTTEDERLVNSYNLGFNEGYHKALDDNNILYGNEAIEFIKNMAKEPNELQKKFLNDCIELMKNLKEDKDVT